MKKLLWLGLLLCPSLAHATNCALTAGASVATITSAVSAASAGGCTGTADAGTVLFGAGSYSITSQVPVPCGSHAVTLTGPTVAWPGPYTANLNGSAAFTWGFNRAACTNAFTYEYLNWNGGTPSVGGGAIYFAPNVSNVTVTNSYFHGNQANPPSAAGSDSSSSFLWFDGDIHTQTDSNLTITWNQFGATGDCSAIMSQTYYYASGGGQANVGGGCAAGGFHTNLNGLTLEYNSVYYQEEGFKWYSCTWSSTCYTTVNQQNPVVEYNDFSNIHRIGMEAQQTPPSSSPGAIVEFNSFHNPFVPNFGTFGISWPEQGSGWNNVSNNVEDAEAAPGSGQYIGIAIEWWGNGPANNNLVQGYWQNGLDYGYNTGGNSVFGNLICGPLMTSGHFIENEEGSGAPAGLATNISAGTSSACTGKFGAQTSFAPTISPTPTGTYSAPISVTLSDAGYTGSVYGPLGNTTIYYTTNGSTPTTSSTVCNIPPATSCTFLVTQGSTVNAIGMWGAPNQPKSYNAGYGFVPSAVQSAHYVSSGGGGPTLTGVSVSLQPGGSSVVAGNSVQACANMTYTGSITTQVCGPGGDVYGTTPTGWASSNGTDATIGTSGLIQGVAAGSSNITVTAGSFNNNLSPFALTVTAAPLLLGNNQQNESAVTYPNYNQSTYAVTGTSSGGYTVSSCSLNLGSGTSHPAGKLWDCGLIAAPTATTQATSWLCHATYTTVGGAADAGWHTMAISGCGVLPTTAAYWVAINTNETGPASEGYWNCGSSCTGSPPTSGNGTYVCKYVSANYGVYTGMAPTMTGNCGSASPLYQASQYVTLSTVSSVTLVGGYLANPGPTTIISVGGSVQFSAFCTYSNAISYLCYPTADQYGNTVTAFSSSNTAIMNVGNIGSSHPGLAQGVSGGTATVNATLTGGIVVNPPWMMTVSNVPLPYPPTSPRVLRSK